jgi:UDP-N-acetylmuramyl pentapeptide phosphotransferase/UDP-N-acetylglucosamine-1-phosphate transferase
LAVVQSLPLVLSLLVAAVVAPAAVKALREGGFVRENYRGAPVAFPAGIAVIVAALLALIPLSLLQELADADVFRAEAMPVAVYVIGVALLGLLDDLVGSGVLVARGAATAGADPVTTDQPRGWRGHAAATLGGGFSTGAVKAAGSLGLALFALSGTGRDAGEYLLAVAVLVIATNLFNLLDLRPGRSIKALVLLGAALTIGMFDTDVLWTLGLFAGPLLVLLPLDLRERGMLGDTGSNVAGALAGLWLVLTLSPLGQAIALAVMVAATVYGEFRSIAALIDRTPVLRHIDSVGRISHV